MDTEVLFWLASAENDPTAQRIIDDEANSSFRVTQDGRSFLAIGLQGTSKLPGRLASFGRDPTQNDIILTERLYSRNHCHIFFNASTTHLILRDTSGTKATQVVYKSTNNAENKKLQLQDDPRQRILLYKSDLILIIGSAHFQVMWRDLSEPQVRQKVEASRKAFALQRVSPELDVTSLELQRFRPKQYETRSAYTPDVGSMFKRLPMITHEKIKFLGQGAFGTVHEIIDLHTGNVWAVKTSGKKGGNNNSYKEALKREVEVLAFLSHPNIVKFVHSQGWGLGQQVEIFMSVHQGSLVKLLGPHDCMGRLPSVPFFFSSLVQQTLPALAYLHEKGIKHLDIKPGNILCDEKDGSLMFYLADFGISQKDTRTYHVCGTAFYMAPEISRAQEYTVKADIWSFGIMILQILGYFCHKDADFSPEAWRQRMAQLPGYIPNMVLETPLESLCHTRWPGQNRFYGRLEALFSNNLAPDYLTPLLCINDADRPDAKQCLEIFHRYGLPAFSLPCHVPVHSSAASLCTKPQNFDAPMQSPKLSYHPEPPSVAREIQRAQQIQGMSSRHGILSKMERNAIGTSHGVKRVAETALFGRSASRVRVR